MNVVMICFLCITIFVPTVVNGIQCYECLICDNPFNKNTANITTTNSTNESCYKYAASGFAASRGVMANCVTLNAFGYGTWCCNTDLCNAAQLTVSMNFKLIISTLFITIAMSKIIQSN